MPTGDESLREEKACFICEFEALAAGRSELDVDVTAVSADEVTTDDESWNDFCDWLEAVISDFDDSSPGEAKFDRSSAGAVVEDASPGFTSPVCVLDATWDDEASGVCEGEPPSSCCCSGFGRPLNISRGMSAIAMPMPLASMTMAHAAADIGSGG